MDQHDRVPEPFPVRKVADQQWEVLIATENTWLSCETEEDARIIAKGAVLEYESLERTRSGPAFADELERQADTYKKYNLLTGSRFFGRRAEEVRRAAGE